MKINDEGIILNKKKYRESSLLVTFFSLNHGINSGLVKGVLKKDFGTYEIGNKVYIKSSFRLDEQLWNCKFELIKNNSVEHFNDQNKLNTLLTVCSIIDLTLPRNNPQIKIYNKTIDLIDNLLSKKDVLVQKLDEAMRRGPNVPRIKTWSDSVHELKKLKVTFSRASTSPRIWTGAGLFPKASPLRLAEN